MTHYTDAQIQVAIELVRRFNELNGTSHRYNSTTVQNHVLRYIGMFGQDTVVQYIEEVRNTDIYNALQGTPLASYKENKQAKAVSESKPTATVDNAIGLIERALAQVMLEKYAPQVAEEAVKSARLIVEREFGTIQRKVEYKVLEKTVLSETTHEKFNDILDLVMINKPVYISGPSGSGKNVIASQVARVLQRQFNFSNAIQQVYQLVGFKDAAGNYQETEFYRAYTQGNVFFLDEMDASNPELLIWLNAAIANGYCEFPVGLVYAHENFRIIAAGNTSGKGATEKYVTRQTLDMATLNRFVEVEVGYSNTIEDSIAVIPGLADFVRDYRKATEKSGYNTVVSYREIINLRDMINGLKWELVKAVKYALTKSTQADDLKMIYNEMNDKRSEFAKAVEQLSKGVR